MGLFSFLSNLFSSPASAPQKSKTLAEFVKDSMGNMSDFETPTVFGPNFSFDIVGMKYNDVEPGKYICYLQEEPNNKFDSNAVALYTLHSKKVIGHVAKPQNLEVKKVLRGKKILYICEYTGRGTMYWGYPLTYEYFVQRELTEGHFTSGVEALL